MSENGDGEPGSRRPPAAPVAEAVAARRRAQVVSGCAGLPARAPTATPAAHR